MKLVPSEQGGHQSAVVCWWHFPADVEVLDGDPSGAIHSSRGTELCEARARSNACSCGRGGGGVLGSHKSLSRVKGSDRTTLFCLAGKGTARTYGWKLS